MESAFTRPICDEAQKTCFTSKHDARKSLVGQLASKSVRVYFCDNCYAYHLTKEWADQQTSLRSDRQRSRKRS